MSGSLDKIQKRDEYLFLAQIEDTEEVVLVRKSSCKRTNNSTRCKDSKAQKQRKISIETTSTIPQ
jgi:hypothetical protein